MERFYSHGKVLLTAEYGVLDGALALALPAVFGQDLMVGKQEEGHLLWQSLDHQGEIWLEVRLDLSTRSILQTTDAPKAETLLKLLLEAQRLNPSFLNSAEGILVRTHLDFPRNWGLGTSSTLVNNIGQWAQVDPYQLLWNVLSGSGYDLACAQAQGPVLYQLVDGKPQTTPIVFDPPFKEQLFFVYLNQKRNSAQAVAQYKRSKERNAVFTQQLTQLTQAFLRCTEMAAFEALMEEHEALMAQELGATPVKAERFPDYVGAIKSLGAWGGDFVLATGNEKTPDYFQSRGFDTIVPYVDMVL